MKQILGAVLRPHLFVRFMSSSWEFEPVGNGHFVTKVQSVVYTYTSERWNYQQMNVYGTRWKTREDASNNGTRDVCVWRKRLGDESKTKISCAHVRKKRMGQETIVMPLPRSSKDTDRYSRLQLILAKKHRDINVILQD